MAADKAGLGQRKIWRGGFAKRGRSNREADLNLVKSPNLNPGNCQMGWRSSTCKQCGLKSQIG